MDHSGPGERSDYPQTIDNGAGERLTSLGIRSDDHGEYLEARNSVSPGSGPPMHVHHLQEEVLIVQRGTMANGSWSRRGASGWSGTCAPPFRMRWRRSSRRLSRSEPVAEC